MSSDKPIQCVECKEIFVFSRAMQSAYRKAGYHDPKRCKRCRSQKKNDLPTLMSLLDEEFDR